MLPNSILFRGKNNRFKSIMNIFTYYSERISFEYYALLSKYSYNALRVPKYFGNVISLTGIQLSISNNGKTIDYYPSPVGRKTQNNIR